MKTKLTCTLSTSLLLLGLVSLAQDQATDQSEDDAIKVVRNTLKADRQAVLTQSLQLTDQESKEFWPIYQQYRTDMDKVGDDMVKMVKEYASLYPNIPDDRAKDMLKELTSMQEKKLTTRTSFLRKSGRVLSPSKNLRLAQLENRMDLLVALKLASNIPLTPIEGRMTGETTSAALTEKGVPGGAVVQTYELTAAVAAIDKEKRKVTLVDQSGIKSTVKCGPEVINFDQIQVGDQVKVTATERLVVFVAKKGEAPPSATGAEMVALAPKGAKPGGMMAETTQISAKITALDPEQHKATLQFEDGSTTTVPVRQDVDLSKVKVDDDVVLRITESLAMKVVKP
jgi:hypothetical protein